MNASSERGHESGIKYIVGIAKCNDALWTLLKLASGWGKFKWMCDIWSILQSTLSIYNNCQLNCRLNAINNRLHNIKGLMRYGCGSHQHGAAMAEGMKAASTIQISNSICHLSIQLLARNTIHPHNSMWSTFCQSSLPSPPHTVCSVHNYFLASFSGAVLINAIGWQTECDKQQSYKH